MIREKLNGNPKVAGAVVAVAVIVCVAIGWGTFRPRHVSGAMRMYYTTDDSSQEGALAALFVDEGDRLPPFDHEGKPAYLALVFTADGGKTKYVGYLQRYTDKGLQMMEDLRAGKIQDDPANPAGSVMADVANKYTEVKKPGEGEWVLQGDKRAKAVMGMTPPDGQDGAGVKAVFPLIW